MKITVDIDVSTLDLKPESFVVVRSDDVDASTIQSLRTQFEEQLKRKVGVLGIGSYDDISVLDIKPESIIVVRSDDVDAEVVQYLSEQFGELMKRKVGVLGIGTHDEISTIKVTSDTVLVVKSDFCMLPEEQDAMEKLIVEKTGCKSVLFIIKNTGCKNIKAKNVGPPWCSPSMPCTSEKCFRDGRLDCCCSCHKKG